MSEERGITIECSPSTFARAQEDPAFLSELVQNAEATNDPIIECENEDIQPTENYAEDNQLGECSSYVGEKRVWVDAAVKLLLSLVAEFRPKLGKSIKFKNKAKMWKEIENVLTEKGYKFTPIQIENKYRGLERSFKKTKGHNNKTGRNRESCPYEKELAEILNERPAVFPTFLAGTSRTETLTREDLVTAAGSSSAVEGEMDVSGSSNLSDFNSSSPTSNRRRKNKNEDILEELRLLREERKEQTATIISTIKESSKRREELMKERNDILRVLADSSKNK